MGKNWKYWKKLPTKTDYKDWVMDPYIHWLKVDLKLLLRELKIESTENWKIGKVEELKDEKIEKLQKLKIWKIVKIEKL